MAVVYFILYKIITAWIDDKNGFKLVLYFLMCLIVGAFIMRIIMQMVIWPYVYDEAGPVLNIFGLVARYFYSFLDLLQIVGLAVCIKFYKLSLEAIKREKNLIMERSRAEVLHLKAQTNPHFLFNTLNSIYSLARSKSEQTADTVMRLSKLLRYTLYDTDKKTISIEEEIKVIKNYIELQQLRFASRVEMKLELYIDSENTQIAPLLLLPIIENAYKHCEESSATIVFNIKLVHNQLSLKTSNPVSGEAQINKGTGLQNLKRQLELLYKEYTLEYSILNKQFDLELIINLNSYAGNELFNTGR